MAQLTIVRTTASSRERHQSITSSETRRTILLPTPLKWANVEATIPTTRPLESTITIRQQKKNSSAKSKFYSPKQPATKTCSVPATHYERVTWNEEINNLSKLPDFACSQKYVRGIDYYYSTMYSTWVGFHTTQTYNLRVNPF